METDLQKKFEPRVEWRRREGHFNTQNRCFLNLHVLVDLSGDLWRESEFQIL